MGRLFRPPGVLPSACDPCESVRRLARSSFPVFVVDWDRSTATEHFTDCQNILGYVLNPYFRFRSRSFSFATSAESGALPFSQGTMHRLTTRSSEQRLAVGLLSACFVLFRGQPLSLSLSSLGTQVPPSLLPSDASSRLQWHAGSHFRGQACARSLQWHVGSLLRPACTSLVRAHLRLCSSFPSGSTRHSPAGGPGVISRSAQ